MNSNPPRNMPWDISDRILEDMFRPAFILPVAVPSQFIDHDVPFIKNLDSDASEWNSTMTSRRDLTGYYGFWQVYAVASWQAVTSVDKDPDFEPDRVGETYMDKNETAFYVETDRETENSRKPRFGEEKTIAHELGHAGGSPSDHSDGGLMDQNATGSSFKPITIRRFRVNPDF